MIIARLKDEAKTYHSQLEKEVDLVKDKQTYQKLLVSQEGAIKTLKIDNSQFK